MNITRPSIAVAAVLLSATGFCFAQSSPTRANSASTPATSSSSPSATTSGTTSTTTTTGAPYTEGTVWAITMVKTKAGMSDDYIKGLAKTYKAAMEEEKKANLVVSYKILMGDSSNAADYNMLLMVEYKNMAAFDGLRDKMEPIAQKVLGGEDERRQAAVKRLEVREILGNKVMREITLK
ncbi:MAG: hypothetical protein QOD12_686 [Verrucomicrobiota bacterium]